MDNILQIIIPAYNAKETLDVTLSSIAIQRTDYRFSVLIVNDHSDYDYSDFIKKYSKYFNIEEIFLKKNVGPYMARQKGIDNSSSKYVIFVDADDILYSPYSIDRMIRVIENENLDLLIGDYFIEKDGMQVKTKDPVSLFGKVYKRSFLEKNNIIFRNIRCKGEIAYNKLIMLLNPHFNFLSFPTYVYKYNHISDSNSIIKDKPYDFESFADNIMWAMKKALNNNVKKEVLYEETCNTMLSAFYYYLNAVNKNDKKKVLKAFKEIFDKYYKKELMNKLNYLFVIRRIENTFYNVITYNDFILKMEEYND